MSAFDEVLYRLLRPALRDAWNEGWHAHYLQEARQERDPSHPITKNNPHDTESATPV